MKEILRKIATTGLDRLSDSELADYYDAMCEHVGLDPITRPFEYLTLQGKRTLYAKKAATDQLAAKHGLRRELVDGPKVIEGNLLYAKARVTWPDGRWEEDVATVRSDRNAENAYMVCATKAKRRATLSALGLGMLDESELDTIPEAKAQKPAPAPKTLRDRILVARGQELLAMAAEVAEGAHEEQEAYVARWRSLLPSYDDATLDKVLKRMEAIPAALKEDEALWAPVTEYLAQRKAEAKSPSPTKSGTDLEGARV